MAATTWGAFVLAQPAQAATTHELLAVGDSLATEMAINNVACPKGTACHTKTIPEFAATHTGWQGIVKAFPGIAVCDMLVPGNLPDFLATYHPNVVVLETEGNSYTPCMDDPATGQPYPIGSDGYYAKYTSDFDSFISQVTATGAKVVGVPPLVTSNSTLNVALSKLSQIMKTELAKYPHTYFTVAPSDAVTKNGVFTFTKACLSTEGTAKGCVAGQITVREPAGIHFCPVGLTWPDGCPDYSSGAFRYGRAIVNQAVYDFSH